MHFSDINEGGGSKVTKIAIVAALHVAVGAALVKNMNMASISMPKLPDEIVMITPEIPKPPPPPPEPPRPEPRTAPMPKPFVPPVDIDVPQQPQVEQTIQTSSVPDPSPPVPGPAQPEAPPAKPNNGAMRTAVLADANACAKPDYPARAARNGESGTVTLALLVGTDGRVTDSRVQKSSGSRDLDRAAVNALSLCKFKPATNGGVAEPAWGQIAYAWTLED